MKILIITTVLLACAGEMLAESPIWSASPVSGDWNTADNWVPAVVPNGPEDTATFSMSNTTTVSVSEATEVNGIVFDSIASPFTVTVSPDLSLTLSGSGVTNSSGNTQNLIVAGLLNFAQGAGAGSMVSIINEESATPNTSTGTNFFANSGAGSADITNNGSATDGVSGGQTVFLENSSAENATFANNSAAVSGAGTGVTYFLDVSTAANAMINNNNGDFGNGLTLFRDSSSAGSATINNSGGAVGACSAASRRFITARMPLAPQSTITAPQLMAESAATLIFRTRRLQALPRSTIMAVR